MVPTLSRFLTLNQRKQSARRLGFNFRRAGDFTLPSEIRIDSRNSRLSLPDDGGTRTAFIDVLLDDCYGLRKLPANLERVLDIGAHAGLFSLAARLRFPNAQIHAYEPNPQMQSFLSKQADIGRFSFFGCAVGLAEGRVSLDLCDDSVQTRVHAGEQGEIQCVSFAQAVAGLNGVLDLVKLDCEGAEYDILFGLRPGTAERIAQVSLEAHKIEGRHPRELEDRLRALGFQVRTGPLVMYAWR